MFLLALLVACNDCNYFEQCDGNTLLVCGEGVDQQVNRKVKEVPCEGDNPVCVAAGDTYATCAVSDESCDPSAPATCDGDLLLSCYDMSYTVVSGESVTGAALVAYDCADDGLACVADEAYGAVCG